MPLLLFQSTKTVYSLSIRALERNMWLFLAIDMQLAELRDGAFAPGAPSHHSAVPVCGVNLP